MLETRLTDSELARERERYAVWCEKVNMSKRQRLMDQVEHLRVAFQTPYPVRVVVVKPTKGRGDSLIRGLTYRAGKTIVIALNDRFPLWSMRDTLNHEWAHAMDWRPESLERMRWTLPAIEVFEDENGKAAAQYIHEQVHDDHFYLDLGRVERAYEGWDI